jgi:hypothetical protein
MSYFLLVITVMLSNGQKTVTIEKFDTHGECVKAMMAVNEDVPNLTASCKEITRGN